MSEPKPRDPLGSMLYEFQALWRRFRGRSWWREAGAGGAAQKVRYGADAMSGAEDAMNSAEDLLASQLVRRVASDEVSLDLGAELRPIADVSADVDRFRSQFQWFAQAEAPMPCLVREDEPPIPIDLDSFDPGTELGWESRTQAVSPSDFMGNARRVIQQLAERSHMGYEEYAPDAVLEFLQTHLSGFLRVRLSAQGRNARTSTKSQEARSSGGGGGGGFSASQPFASGPGIAFVVHTRASGLRVHYAPSYLLTNALVFGSPTTPVQGRIQAGRWSFGGMSRALPLTWDPAIFQVPPATSASLTVV